MVTSTDIRTIFDSLEFRSELEELSRYAASMKQERQIVLLLAKYLWRNGHKASPELKKCDLNVDGKRIEFKFHYDADVYYICKEMEPFGDDFELMVENLHPTRKSGPGIYKDVITKSSDVFVLVVCARNFSGLSADELNRVCLGKFQTNFNKKFNPYVAREKIFKKAEDFLQRLTRSGNRPCSIQTSTAETYGYFPSTYHMIICDFDLGERTDLKEKSA